MVKSNPHEVYNLAAQSHVAVSFEVPEYTANADALGALRILEAIKILNLTKNKTTLVIAHRLSTIHNADKIFVLKDGKIINSGDHDFLINNCEEYKSLYKKQYISIRDGNVSFKPKNENFFLISAGSVKKNEINVDQIL